jgi:hypothetical protein
VQPLMGAVPLLKATVPLPAGETVAVSVVLWPALGELGAAASATELAALLTTTTSGGAVALK